METILLPGAEFFFQRVQAAECLLEAQRTADQKLMLQLHTQLSAIATALRQSAAALRPNEEEVGGPAAVAGGPPATAALLGYLAADWCDAPASTHHPELPPQLLARHLPPLVQLRRSGESGLAMTFTPLLEGYLDQTRLLPEEDIDVVVRLMAFASIGQLAPTAADNLQQLRAALAALATVTSGSSLFTDRRRFERQLRRLARRLQDGGCGGNGPGGAGRGEGLRAAPAANAEAAAGGGHGSGSGSDGGGGGGGGGRQPPLPSVDQLRVACHHLRFSLVHRFNMSAGRDAMWPVLEPLARAMERLQPDSPRPALLLAMAVSPEETHLRDPCRHFRWGRRCDRRAAQPRRAGRLRRPRSAARHRSVHLPFAFSPLISFLT